MKLIKQINERVAIDEQQIAVFMENVSTYMDDSVDIILETAEEFLGHLSLLVRNDKLKDTDNNMKNHLAMLAALSMLKNANARSKVKANSVESYMNLIDNITKDLKLTTFEANILKHLDSMKDDSGKTGLQLRGDYIKLYQEDRDQLVKEINKLQSKYRQIYGHLKNMSTKHTTASEPVGATA